MALLKRLSYEREHGKVSDIDYKLYLLGARPLNPSETQEERNNQIAELLKTKEKDNKTMESNIGKYAMVKDEVSLPENSLAQVHFHPYRIVNENRRKTWVCLESKINVLELGAGGTRELVEDRSFWMKVEECNIYNGE
jgi:hypothetical protein